MRILGNNDHSHVHLLLDRGTENISWHTGLPEQMQRAVHGPALRGSKTQSFSCMYITKNFQFYRIISFFLLPLRLVKKGVIWLIRKYESVTAWFVWDLRWKEWLHSVLFQEDGISLSVECLGYKLNYKRIRGAYFSSRRENFFSKCPAILLFGVQRGLSPWGKVSGAWSWPPTPSSTAATMSGARTPLPLCHHDVHVLALPLHILSACDWLFGSVTTGRNRC